MLFTSNILLQSSSFDDALIVNKLSKLIFNITDQLKTEHLDRLIHSSIEDVPNEAKNDIIDGIIRGRCSSLKILPKLTKSEQLYILANSNLSQVTPELEEMLPDFADLVYSIVREALMSG